MRFRINFYPLRFDVSEQSAQSKQRQHLRLVGECLDAQPHPSHRGKPLSTSDSSPTEPSSRAACLPSGDSNDASTCGDPTDSHFTFSLSRELVFTTNTFTDFHEQASKTHTANRNVREFQARVTLKMCSKNLHITSDRGRGAKC